MTEEGKIEEQTGFTLRLRIVGEGSENDRSNHRRSVYSIYLNPRLHLSALRAIANLFK